MGSALIISLLLLLPILCFLLLLAIWLLVTKRNLIREKCITFWQRVRLFGNFVRRRSTLELEVQVDRSGGSTPSLEHQNVAISDSPQQSYPPSFETSSSFLTANNEFLAPPSTSFDVIVKPNCSSWVDGGHEYGATSDDLNFSDIDNWPTIDSACHSNSNGYKDIHFTSAVNPYYHNRSLSTTYDNSTTQRKALVNSPNIKREATTLDSKKLGSGIQIQIQAQTEFLEPREAPTQKDTTTCMPDGQVDRSRGSTPRLEDQNVAISDSLQQCYPPSFGTSSSCLTTNNKFVAPPTASFDVIVKPNCSSWEDGGHEYGATSDDLNFSDVDNWPTIDSACRANPNGYNDIPFTKAVNPYYHNRSLLDNSTIQRKTLVNSPNIKREATTLDSKKLGSGIQIQIQAQTEFLEPREGPARKDTTICMHDDEYDDDTTESTDPTDYHDDLQLDLQISELQACLRDHPDPNSVIREAQNLLLGFHSKKSDESTKCDLIIGVDATPATQAGYCINRSEKSLQYYAVRRDDFPWIIHLEKDTSEFEMKNLIFALTLWHSDILKYKRIRIYTDNFALVKKTSRYGARAASLLDHYVRCKQVKILNKGDVVVNKYRNLKYFAKYIQPADDLSRWRMEDAVKFLTELYEIDEGSVTGTHVLAASSANKRIKIAPSPHAKPWYVPTDRYEEILKNADGIISQHQCPNLACSNILQLSLKMKNGRRKAKAKPYQIAHRK